MSVKPGYKMTEVGVIPEDWKVNPLSSVINELIAGVSVRSDEAQTNSSGAYILKTSAVSNGKFIPSQKKLILRADVWRARLSPKTETIIISRMNTPYLVGEVGFVDSDHADLFLPDRLWMTSVSCETSAKWLSLLLSSDEYKMRLRSAATGTSGSMKNIAKPALLSLPVPFPPLPEQTAIAQTLTDVDALIESLSATLAKKRDIKQATMQLLLTGTTRLPGFEGEWRDAKLSDCLLCSPDYGINAAAVPYADNLPNYLRITDISDTGRFCPSPRVSVRAINASKYYLEEGDLVFARTGASVGKSYLYSEKDGRLVFAGFLIRVRPNRSTLVPTFLANLVQTGPFWDWVKLMSMRSGQPGVNGNEFASLPVLLPPLPEQLAIAQTLTDLDAELTALEARIEKTRALKLGMMQELLTGRTRLI
jgi:type I restriction enzyme, S subunit